MSDKDAAQGGATGRRGDVDGLIDWLEKVIDRLGDTLCEPGDYRSLWKSYAVVGFAIMLLGIVCGFLVGLIT